MSRPDSIAETTDENERLWRFADVVHRLNIGRRTLERLLSAGRFPRPDLRIGRATLWRPETVRAWIDAEARRQAQAGGRS